MREPSLNVYDSITHAGAEAAGAVVICGSHGGMFVGALAARLGVHAIVLCDAGIGCDAAGISGVMALERAGIAAAAVAHDSARIGDGADIAARGRVSRTNAIASAAGVVPGQSVREAVARLREAERRQGAFAQVGEARQVVRLGPGREVVLIDSVSLLVPKDAGRIVVTGSHGGLLGGRPETAAKVDAGFLAFSDAGIGMDRAGLGRLPVLEARGIAAVTVSHDSARIGDAVSIHATGVISAANGRAEARGFVPGVPLARALENCRWEDG